MMSFQEKSGWLGIPAFSYWYLPDVSINGSTHHTGVSTQAPLSPSQKPLFFLVFCISETSIMMATPRASQVITNGQLFCCFIYLWRGLQPQLKVLSKALAQAGMQTCNNELHLLTSFLAKARTWRKVSSLFQAMRRCITCITCRSKNLTRTSLQARPGDFYPLVI